MSEKQAPDPLEKMSWEIDKYYDIGEGSKTYEGNRAKWVLSKLREAQELAVRAERERNKNLRMVLEYAVCRIQDWHDISNRSEITHPQALKAWDIYYNKSPEMALIREELKEPADEQQNS